MKIPIDIFAVMDAANGNDEARKSPISVSLYLDDSAPADIVGHVRTLFASAATHARITIGYLGNAQAIPNPSDDIAVIVGGFHNDVGRLAHAVREAGVPAMVVTSMPAIVKQVASENDFPIPEADIIMLDKPEETPEPYELTEEDFDELDTRMGEWIIAVAQEKRLAFATAFPFVCRPLSLDAVGLTSLENALVGALVFVPGACLPIMTLNQMKMMLQIAAAYGAPMDAERIKELAAILAAGLACRTVSRTVSEVLPVMGPFVRIGIGYGGTQAMGRATIEYFENGGGVAGLGKTVAEASNAALKAVESVRAAVNGEEPAPEPEPEKDTWAKIADTAKSLGGHATKIGSVAAKVATPLAQSAASSGVESVTKTVKTLMGRK